MLGMLGMLWRDGIFKVVFFFTLGVIAFNLVNNYTPDDVVGIVQEIEIATEENLNKGFFESLIDWLGEMTKAMFRFFIELGNIASGRSDIGDGVNLLFGTFNDMTGIGFGSTYESFTDGFCDEMSSNLNKYFDKLIPSWLLGY